MKNKMLWFILLSIILGISFGIAFPNQMIAINWIGKIFINMLKLIVLPLIFCSLVTAIAALGSGKKLGSIGFYTIAYVICSVSIAVLIGLTLLNIFQPGLDMPPELILANASPTEPHLEHLSDFLLTLFPQNIIEAAVKFEIMPIVFFSIVFAVACIMVGESAKPVVAFFIGLRNVFIKMIIWLMYLTPIGLFSLLGNAVAEASIQHKLLDGLQGMLIFIAIFLFGLVCQFGWQFIAIKLITGRNPFKFLRSSSDALITAFATSSSLATLPVTMMVAKKRKYQRRSS